MQLLSQSRQFFFFNDTATTEIYTLSYTTLFRSVPDRGRAAAVEHVDHLLVQLPLRREALAGRNLADIAVVRGTRRVVIQENRSEEHTSELQSRSDIVCRLLLENKKQSSIIVNVT